MFEFEIILRWVLFAAGFSGGAAVAFFNWVPPDKLVATVAFVSLMLVASLAIRVISNERRAASATHLQAAE